jgi:hypothetical protein
VRWRPRRPRQKATVLDRSSHRARQGAHPPGAFGDAPASPGPLASVGRGRTGDLGRAIPPHSRRPRCDRLAISGRSSMRPPFHGASSLVVNGLAFGLRIHRAIFRGDAKLGSPRLVAGVRMRITIWSLHGSWIECRPASLFDRCFESSPDGIVRPHSCSGPGDTSASGGSRGTWSEVQRRSGRRAGASPLATAAHPRQGPAQANAAGSSDAGDHPAWCPAGGTSLRMAFIIRQAADRPGARARQRAWGGLMLGRRLRKTGSRGRAWPNPVRTRGAAGEASGHLTTCCRGSSEVRGCGGRPGGPVRNRALTLVAREGPARLLPRGSRGR